MTPIMFIYKCVHKSLYLILHAYHTVATWVKLKGNGVMFSSFTSNGVPKVWVTSGKGAIYIGQNFQMNNGNSMNVIGYGVPCSLQAEDATITIGKNVGMSQATVFALGADITIGDNTLLGGGVKIYSSDFHSMNYEYRRDSTQDGLDHRYRKCAPVIIGHDCFVGAGSLILKGITVGDRAVIGAGSVVTKNVPADELWAGNPARFIRKICNII